MIHGLHMRFWPIWLDFWRGNKGELTRQFKEETAYVNYYGGKSTVAHLFSRNLKNADIAVIEGIKMTENMEDEGL